MPPVKRESGTLPRVEPCKIIITWGDTAAEMLCYLCQLEPSQTGVVWRHCMVCYKENQKS